MMGGGTVTGIFKRLVCPGSKSAPNETSTIKGLFDSITVISAKIKLLPIMGSANTPRRLVEPEGEALQPSNLHHTKNLILFWGIGQALFSYRCFPSRKRPAARCQLDAASRTCRLVTPEPPDLLSPDECADDHHCGTPLSDPGYRRQREDRRPADRSWPDRNSGVHGCRHRRSRQGNDGRCRPGDRRSLRPGEHVPPDAASWCRPDRRAGRFASVHGLAGAYPDRLRRVSGHVIVRFAEDRPGRRHVPIPYRRQPPPPDAGHLHGVAR